jgi:hypothetical protein
MEATTAERVAREVKVECTIRQHLFTPIVTRYAPPEKEKERVPRANPVHANLSVRRKGATTFMFLERAKARAREARVATTQDITPILSSTDTDLPTAVNWEKMKTTPKNKSVNWPTTDTDTRKDTTEEREARVDTGTTEVKEERVDIPLQFTHPATQFTNRLAILLHIAMGPLAVVYL